MLLCYVSYSKHAAPSGLNNFDRIFCYSSSWIAVVEDVLAASFSLLMLGRCLSFVDVL